MNDMTLVDAVRGALNGRKGEWPVLAKNNGVSYSWLSKFAMGQTDNPAHRTLERIAASLGIRYRVESTGPAPTEQAAEAGA